MPLDDIDNDDNKLKILTKQIDLQFKSPLENLFLLKTKKNYLCVTRNDLSDHFIPFIFNWKHEG